MNILDNLPENPGNLPEVCRNPLVTAEIEATREALLRLISEASPEHILCACTHRTGNDAADLAAITEQSALNDLRVIRAAAEELGPRLAAEVSLFRAKFTN